MGLRLFYLSVAVFVTVYIVIKMHFFQPLNGAAWGLHPNLANVVLISPLVFVWLFVVCTVWIPTSRAQLEQAEWDYHAANRRELLGSEHYGSKEDEPVLHKSQTVGGISYQVIDCWVNDSAQPHGSGSPALTPEEYRRIVAINPSLSAAFRYEPPAGAHSREPPGSVRGGARQQQQDSFSIDIDSHSQQPPAHSPDAGCYIPIDGQAPNQR